MEQQINTIHFDHDSITYIAPSWQQLQAAIFELSQKISLQPKFDLIVGVASGSLPYAVMLQDYLDITHLVSIGIQSYSGVNQAGPVKFFQQISEKLEGKRVLLFDDVTDSGHTMSLAKQYLVDKQVQSVMTCTLFHKLTSVITPDYYALETSSWIVFPQDVWETMTVLSERWQDAQLTKAQLHACFTQMGFASEVITVFLDQKFSVKKKK